MSNTWTDVFRALGGHSGLAALLVIMSILCPDRSSSHQSESLSESALG